MNSTYTTDEPDRETLKHLAGPAIVEFGAPWCPWCQGAQPYIAEMMEAAGDIPHYKIEDGKGRALGRAWGEALANADLSARR